MQKRLPEVNSSNEELSAIPQSLLESLSFDDIAAQIEALKALIFEAPDQNEAKIAFFKEEIASGRYEVQAEIIAEKLLESHVIESLDEALEA